MLSPQEIEAIADAVYAKMQENKGASGDALPDSFLPTRKIPEHLPQFKNIDAVRRAYRNGEFRSGSEVKKTGTGRILVNPAAYRERTTKQQQKRKIC